MENANQNKEMFTRLQLYIKICTSTIEKAKNKGIIPDKTIIELFELIINDSIAFIENYKEKSSFFKFFLSGNLKEDFNDLMAKLGQVSSMLSACLQVECSPAPPIDQKITEGIYEKCMKEETKELGKNVVIKTTDSEDIKNIKKKQAENLRLYLDGVMKKAQISLTNNVRLPKGIKEIFSPELVYESKIGTWKYGIVYKGQYYRDTVAIKTMEDISKNSIDKILREVHHLSRGKGPNAMEIFGICIEPGFECIIMEIPPNNNFEEMEEEEEFEEEDFGQEEDFIDEVDNEEEATSW